MTKIWAHRGASAYAPENTLEAFRLAVEQGADGIELDVQLSADGRLVVIHDETVDRTSDGTGAVAELTCAQLKKLDFSNGFSLQRPARIPTLKEAYGMLKNTSLQIIVDIKGNDEDICSKLLDLEAEMGMQGRLLYTSVDHYMLTKLKKTDRDVRIGLLYDCVIAEPWVYARHVEASAILPHYGTLKHEEILSGCAAAGIDINAWTVDDPVWINALVDNGVAGVITNFPDVAVNIRNEKAGM